MVMDKETLWIMFLVLAGGTVVALLLLALSGVL